MNTQTELLTQDIVLTVKERAVLYARVSKDDTKNDGRNLQGQLDMGREYAEENGYLVVAELPEDDRGASGAEIDLPQLNRLRAMASRGEFDVLVVRELDRLSRNLAKQLIVEEELKKAGVRIEYVLANYANNPEGQLSKHIKGVIAEYEREKIKERLIRGVHLKIESGKVLGNTQPPFGYKWANKSKTAFVLDEIQAPIVRHIFEWYVSGLSMTKIKQQLEMMGIAAPGYNRRGGAVKRTPAHIWYLGAISSILNSTTYRGQWRYGRLKQGITQRLNVNVPPIVVSVELFEATQERLKHNREKAKRSKIYDYLLAGHAYCAECGQRMYGFSRTTSKAPILYYGCAASSGKIKGATCHNPFHRADEIEWQIWGWVKGLLLDEAQLRQELEAYQAEESKRFTPILSELETIANLINGIEIKRGRLVELYASGVFGLEEIKEQKSAYDLQLTKLKERKLKLEAQLNQTLTEKQKLEIEDFAAQVRKGLTKADGEDKFKIRRRIVELLQLRVMFGANDEGQKTANVTCILQPKSWRLELDGQNQNVGLTFVELMQ